MENRYHIDYDIKQRVTTNVRFKQGDIDSSVLEVKIIDNSLPVDITDEAIEFRFLKPDHTVVFQDNTAGVTILDGPGGIVECVLRSNTLAAPGIVKCEIHREKDGKELTTPSFTFLVESSIGEDGVLSTNYISIVESKIIEWQSQETARQSNETNRQTNETDRINAENTRQAQENTRQINENTRQTNENTRQTNENTRQSQETARQSNETNRQTNETDRINAENTRQANEIIRQSNEDIRQSEFNIMKTAYEAATHENTVVELTVARHDNITGIDYDDIGKRMDAHSAQFQDLQGYIGYTNNDIYGVEVDFANRTFTRLAGAVGKTPGADFDSILAFGGRYRCNLTDEGVEVAKYGDIGYTETGALTQAITIEGVTYAAGTPVQVMVKQPKFYYKVVPLKLEKNDAEEIDRIEFTAGASSDGDITISLNGQSFNVAVLASDNTATAIATKVRNATFNGWTTGGSGATVTFTRNKKGVCAAPTFNGRTTGVTANVARTQVGYIGKGFKLRKARYYVSMTKKAGFKVHPAFVQNGVEREFIYLSAYEGCLWDKSAGEYILNDAQIADFTVSTGDKLSSIANAKPISGVTQDLTRRKCGILAENRGTGWSQQYAATAACTQLLFTVEYATLNSQTAIGKGVVDKPYVAGQNDSEITGATTLLGNASGMAAGTNGLTPITYRGEENLWGNIWKFTDGMNVYCDASQGIHSLYIADNAFAESKNTDNYKNAGITLATKEGYVSAMAYNEEFDWLFVPAETTGDSALPVGDYFYMSASTNGYKTARLGGSWHYGLNGGAFVWTVPTPPSTRDAHIGGRLVYVPAA